MGEQKWLSRVAEHENERERERLRERASFSQRCHVRKLHVHRFLCWVRVVGQGWGLASSIAEGRP